MLLFATIIIALSVYQASVVPAENSDVEYRHSQQVQGQLVDVRNALVSTATTGDGRPATVSLGTEYPNRVFLVNPPPAAGTLRTNTYDDPNVTVSNVNATNDETRDYLNGSWAKPTKSLSYVPGYNEYRDAPRLRYEASLLSNYYPDQNTSVPLTEQLVVDEQTRTVSLVALNGSLSTSRSSSVAVDPTALSAPANRVQVQPDDSTEPVNVTIPTVVDAGVLRNSTSLGDNPNVTVAQNGTDRVTLSIDWSGPFTLRTAKVGVGSGATNPAPYYLTLVESDDDSVTVEARDEYNNPESGELVTANRSDVFEDEDGNRTTNEDGRVTFEVNGNPTETPVQFELVDATGSEAQRTVNATVGETSTPAVGNGSGGSLVLVGNGTAFDGEDDDSVPGGVYFNVSNQYSSNVTITDVTVLPESDAIDGLSDKAPGYDYGSSEFAVSPTGQNETVDVPLVDDEYTYVGTRGLTLSLAQNRTETVYDTGSGSFTTTEVNASGTVSLSPNGTARVSFAEFYAGVTSDFPTEVNVTNEDFRVVVAYERDGVRETSEFLVYAHPAAENGGGGGGQSPPAVDSFAASEGNGNDIDADWSVSDPDGDLSSVEVQFDSLDSGDSNTQTTAVSGGSASGTTTYKGNNKEEYEVTIVVTDDAGNTDTETQTVQL